MRTSSEILLAVSALVVVSMWPPAKAELTVAEDQVFSVDAYAGDGRLAIDLLGSIWLVPPDGGFSEALTDSTVPARNPRWSPDGRHILYQLGLPSGGQLWLLDVDDRQSKIVSNSGHHDQDGNWHPDGERIIFSSARRTTGFDLWETDLSSGLSWRLSDRIGDELEPAWSGDGRHLAYIHHVGDEWSIFLRRRGEIDALVVSSEQRLSSVSWRPDGSLLTYLRHGDDKTSLEMVILSEPPVTRPLIDREGFFASPVSWLNRQQMIYAADGAIKTRNFDEWRSRTISFTATVGEPKQQQAREIKRREIPIVDPPPGSFVIRGARLFDGMGAGYRNDVDILIEGPLIGAVHDQRDWSDVTVLDLGDVTVLPGYIDIYSAMPAHDPRQAGAAILAYGVTTIISDEPGTEFDPSVWESETSPGPRLLIAGSLDSGNLHDSGDYPLVTLPASADVGEDAEDLVNGWQERGIPVLAESWATGLSVGADLMLGADTELVRDVTAMQSVGPTALVSGLADAGTPGLNNLLQSRQAHSLQQSGSAARRFPMPPSLASARTLIAVGSKPNGLPPGLALHAELRALTAAGLGPDKVLRAAGDTAGAMLGFNHQLGRVVPGAYADLVLVTGDPLQNVADAANIVAVVRNGRFYSLTTLLERAGPLEASDNLTTQE